MIRRLKKLGRNTLIRGSFFIFVGTFIGNVANYLYQVLMGRMLEPSLYATLFSIISLGYFFSLPTAVLRESVTKIVSEIKARGDEACLWSLFWQLTRLLIGAGVLVLLGLMLINSWLVSFLHLEVTPLIMGFFYLQLVLALLAMVPPGIFRGLLRFEFLAVLGSFPAVIKLVLSVAFVFGGWGLLGVMGAYLLSAVLSLGLAMWLLWRYVFFPEGKESDPNCERIGSPLTGKRSDPDSDLISDRARQYLQRIWQFSPPVLLINLGLVAFHNSDVLLVKHFFPVLEAARYASVMLLGRIIFFSTSAVGMALFPISSLHHTNGEGPEKALRAFRMALLLVLVASGGALIAYTLFPELVVTILFGKKYLNAVPLMPYIAIFMGIYSVVNLLIQFLLAAREIKVFIPLLAGAGLQICGITFYHTSLEQVMVISIGSVIVVLMPLVIWFLRFKYAFGHRSCLQ